ncbi:MAG: biotin-dependent carboxyltransferase family protein [Henriciella sp.]
MIAEILAPGLQTTLQAGQRRGYRHFGMPWAGAADMVSLAYANALLGNALDATALEVSFGGCRIGFEQPTLIALAGAPAVAQLNARDVNFYQRIVVKAGDILTLQHPPVGVRTYIAISGGFSGHPMLGSTSTYLPARLGGYQGRALKTGDRLEYTPARTERPMMELPARLQPTFLNSWSLRVTPSGETALLNPESQRHLAESVFTVGHRCDRMGFALEGPRLNVASDGLMKSAPVFPGTIQCPENGVPFVLGIDAQTTGGYPRIASVALCDQHLLGQCRPGDRIRFLIRTPQQARDSYLAKQNLLRNRLPGFRLC